MFVFTVHIYSNIHHIRDLQRSWELIRNYVSLFRIHNLSLLEYNSPEAEHCCTGKLGDNSFETISRQTFIIRVVKYFWPFLVKMSIYE